MITFVVSIFGWFQAEAKHEVVIPKSIEPFFENYCFDCHNSDTAKADLDLEGLTRSIVDVADAQNWQDILDQLNSGEMPPKKKKQPSKTELSAAIGTLTNVLFKAEEKLKDSGGKIVLRHLNRREYQATIKDLMGINFNLESLPDDASGRFDTIGQNQSLSSMQLKKYFYINRKIASTSLSWAVKPRIKPSVTKLGQGRKGAKSFKGRMLAISGLTGSISLKFMQDARAAYRLSVTGGVVDGVKIRRGVRMTIPKGRLVNKHGELIGSFFITGSIDKPSTHQMIYEPENSLSISTSKYAFRRGISINEDVRGGPGTQQQISHYRPIEPNVPTDTIMIKMASVEGPFYAPKSPFELLVEKYKVASSDDKKLDLIAREFLEEFAAAAFRGNDINPAFIDDLMAYYANERKAGKGFKVAIIDPLALILSSTNFLYLLENSDDEKLRAKSVANRLSYFLWSSPPDSRLMELAESGELLKRDMLVQEVDRLLDSPKAEHFFSGFMSQWMHLKRFDGISVSSRLHLHRTDGMIAASKHEPIEFFKTLVKEDLCATNLIDSDFVMANGILAMKYGLSDLHSGDGFKKIKLPEGSPRGGIMTQAAFLAMGTMANRTSPVIRGALVKEILLNDAPPPPPPNVPELVHEGVDPLASVRSLVELHQKKVQCASCHARFDFIGLGLENFGPVGLWRDEEVVTQVRLAKKLPKSNKKVYDVDASGELPDGTKFKDLFELKKALMKQKRQVAGSLLEGLLCYALGRDISFTDRPLIRQLLDDLEKRQADGRVFAVKEMVKQVVTSQAFLGK